MRHEFGVYAGLASGVAVFVTPRMFAWRRTLTFILLGLILVAPYLIWLERIGQLRATRSSGAGKTTELAMGWDMPRPAVALDLSHGLVHVDPVVARVRVRWAARVDGAGRTVAERKYGLIQGVDEGQRTFAYGLTDSSSANVRALVNDPAVDDTGGINRQTLTLDAPLFDRWLGSLGVTRIIWGPFFDATGASIWLYYFVWAVPLAAMLRLSLRRGASNPEFPNEWRKIGSAALVGVLMNLYLIRGSFDSRLPDVIVPTAIVGPWLTREFIDWAWRPRWPVRAVLTTAGLAIAILFWSSLTTYESTASALRLATAPFRIVPLRKAATELAQTVERLARQQVPLVIVEQSRAEMFGDDYRPVADYVRAHYHLAATSTFVDNRTWDVFAANSRQPTATREGGLPCYR